MSNKKLLIFAADWCLPCRFSNFFWREMVNEGDPVEIINGDDNHQLLQRYEIDKYPTFILLENDLPIAKVIGKQDKEFLKGLIYENRNVSLGE